MERNGTEWNGTNPNPNCFTSKRNITERKGTEWNGKNRYQIFLLIRNGTKQNETELNGMERIEIKIYSIRNGMKQKGMYQNQN